MFATAVVLIASGSMARSPSNFLPPKPVYTLGLSEGRTADVYADGHAVVRDRNFRQIGQRTLPPGFNPAQLAYLGDPDKKWLAAELSKAPMRSEDMYVPNELIVVYREGAGPTVDTVSADGVTTAQAASQSKIPNLLRSAPAFSQMGATNKALISAGVTRSERMFRGADFTDATKTSANRPVSGLSPANAYRLRLNGTMSVKRAAATLSTDPNVLYVAPNWRVSPMLSHPHPPSFLRMSSKANALMPMANSGASGAAAPASSSSSAGYTGIPTNYAVSASAQSFLNAPGVSATPVFSEIWERFHQLPGQGEIITNVSVGDIDDSSDPNDHCAGQVSTTGATTYLVNGQHYIAWPTMPVIPAYVADASGNLDGARTVCGVDPNLVEVGLDFSVMAPLPDDFQRSAPPTGEFAQFDLLGIAPGAQYRLVVPAEANYAGIQGALLGAALQTPRPSVITMSLGYGFDQMGFPSRYLEEDPLTEALVASIVNNYGIVVVISAGDGTRKYTQAAIGPSGGSAALNTVTKSVPSQLDLEGLNASFFPSEATSLIDVYLSTTPSAVFDSGAIAVGATTLNDITAVPPQYATTPQEKAQHAYAATRWTGETGFSTTFGTRVNLSAPGDNILAMNHYGVDSDGHELLGLGLEGGTSASAPEVAAATAVLLQVSKLAHRPFAGPRDVRQYLVQTGTPIPSLPQADALPIGPQLNLQRAVEMMLRGKPAVERIAIAQRRPVNPGPLSTYSFLTDTDPTGIDLAGPQQDPQFTTAPEALNGRNAYTWITLAPDWQYLPSGATFSLTVDGNPRVLASTPWARLQPAEILTAAGLPLARTQASTVALTYTANLQDGRKLSIPFSLSFGPTDGTTIQPPIPKVAAVATGDTLHISYDVSSVRKFWTFPDSILTPGELGLVSYTPTLLISVPGRFFAEETPLDPNYVIYRAPLTEWQGTIDVPLSKLQGAGVYSIGIGGTQVGWLDASGDPQVYAYPWMDYAYARVLAPNGEKLTPPAPTMAYGKGAPTHSLEIPLHPTETIQVNYDVTNFGDGADGALLEISAPGASNSNSLKMFNNPGGSVPDANGFDTGSIATLPLTGTHGSRTFSAEQLGINPGLAYNVRVLPTSKGAIVGSASKESFLMELGLTLPNGGTVSGASFDVTETMGFLSALGTGPQQTGSEIYAFDPASDSVVGPPCQSRNDGDFYGLVGGGFLASDGRGLVLIATSTQFVNISMFDPAANTMTVTPFTSGIANFLLNPASTSGVACGYDDAHQAYVSSFDIASGTTGAPNYLSTVTPMDTWDETYFGQCALNRLTNTALVPSGGAGTDANGIYTYHSALSLFNVTSGQLSFLGTNTVPGMVDAVAVDSATNKAALLTSSSAYLSIVDLSSGGVNSYLLPGADLQDATSGGDPFMANLVASDDIHHLFIVMQPMGYTRKSAADHNPPSNLLVFDEDGNLVKTLSVNLFPSSFLMSTASQYSFLQLLPSRRKGYVLTNTGYSVPFDY